MQGVKGGGHPPKLGASKLGLEMPKEMWKADYNKAQVEER